MPNTVKVRVEVPEGVSAKAGAEDRAHEAAVLALFEQAALTIREAAAELGLSYPDFLDLLAARGIPVERGPLNLTALEEASRKLAERPS